MCRLLVVWRSRERPTVVYAQGSTPQKQDSKKWQQNLFFTVDFVNHMLATFFLISPYFSHSGFTGKLECLMFYRASMLCSLIET